MWVYSLRQGLYILLFLLFGGIWCGFGDVKEVIEVTGADTLALSRS